MHRFFALASLAFVVVGCSHTVSETVTRMQWEPAKGDLHVTSCTLEQDDFSNKVNVAEDGDRKRCTVTTMHLADPNPNGGAPVATPAPSPK